MSQEHPNWIAERAKCNMALLWDDVCTIVTCDTNRRKQEALRERALHRYILRPRNTPQDPLHIERFNMQTGGSALGECRFFYDRRTDVIDVTMKKPDGTGVIVTRWDAANSQCCLVVTRPSDGQEIELPHDELWKVVQYILEPFFFPAA